MKQAHNARRRAFIALTICIFVTIALSAFKFIHYRNDAQLPTLPIRNVTSLTQADHITTIYCEEEPDVADYVQRSLQHFTVKVKIVTLDSRTKFIPNEREPPSTIWLHYKHKSACDHVTK